MAKTPKATGFAFLVTGSRRRGYKLRDGRTAKNLGKHATFRSAYQAAFLAFAGSALKREG